MKRKLFENAGGNQFRLNKISEGRTDSPEEIFRQAGVIASKLYPNGVIDKKYMVNFGNDDKPYYEIAVMDNSKMDNSKTKVIGELHWCYGRWWYNDPGHHASMRKDVPTNILKAAGTENPDVYTAGH